MCPKRAERSRNQKVLGQVHFAMSLSKCSTAGDGVDALMTAPSTFFYDQCMCSTRSWSTSHSRANGGALTQGTEALVQAGSEAPPGINKGTPAGPQAYSIDFEYNVKTNRGSHERACAIVITVEPVAAASAVADSILLLFLIAVSSVHRITLDLEPHQQLLRNHLSVLLVGACYTASAIPSAQSSTSVSHRAQDQNHHNRENGGVLIIVPDASSLVSDFLRQNLNFVAWPLVSASLIKYLV